MIPENPCLSAGAHTIDNPIYASASSLAAAIRSKRISSAEVVDAYLRRIEAVNPKLNAVVQLTADAARTEARSAAAAVARGAVMGPLHGVPVTIKDAFETKDLISTGGTKGRAAYLPAEDATAVARLRAAGAIVLGKTNLPELSTAFESDNLVYGRTNNPYDLSRTPGGSSGGEAAIIAAGGSPLGLGTDAAGSIRVPAHFCGIAGLKPTRGRVPLTGVFPPTIGALGALWHAGPLARFVEDLALTLPLIAGPDWRDASVVPMPLGDPHAVDLKRLRLAFFTDNGILSPTAETAAVVKRATQVLVDAGSAVEEARPAGIEQTYELVPGLFGADDGVVVMQLLQDAGTIKIPAVIQRLLHALPRSIVHRIPPPPGIHPYVLRLGEVVRPYALSTAGFADLLVRWDLFRGAMLSFLERYDVIISPVNANPALLHGTSFDDDKLPGFSYSMTYNLTGWPVTVVRAGTSPEGLPIGVQIAARPWREDVALAVAQEIETALGGWQPPAL